MEDIKNIIESLLFVSEDPLSIGSIKNVLGIEDPKAIRTALKELAENYEKRNGAFLLHEVAGGFQIRTRPEYNQWVKRLLQPKVPRLSKAALETLAIIAYKQPIIRNDVEYIRGVDCGGIIRILLERKLIRVLGRKEIPGRPLIYGTTKQFLEVFDLKNLRDLPTPKEIEELRSSGEENTEPEPVKKSTDVETQQPLDREGDGKNDRVNSEKDTGESQSPEEEILPESDSANAAGLENIEKKPDTEDTIRSDEKES